MRKYFGALVVTIAFAVPAWFYAQWIAGHAAAATSAGRPIGLGEQVAIASGNFILRYYVFLVAAAFCLSLVAASLMRSAEPDGGPGREP